MGANPNIFQNKENRRVVPPGDENFFVTAEEFQAIDTAFASKADQTALDAIDGRLDTAEGDITGLQTQVGIIEGNLTIAEGNISDLLGDVSTIEGDISALQSGKEDVSNKATDFTTVNDTLYPTVQAVDTEIDNEIAFQVPLTDTTQLDTILGIMSLKTKYKRPSGSEINFTTSGLFGTPTLPIYDTFTINEASLTDANRKNEWEMFFSCETIPAIISSPASYMDITGSILTGYESLNRITFVLDYVYNETTDVNELKVIVNIYQQINANEDPNPPVVGDPTLVAWYRFEETSAFDTIIDSSEYGHDATVADAGTTDSTRVAGIVGTALQINQTNAGTRFLVNDNADINVAGNTPITVMCWVRLTATDITNNEVQGIFEKGGFRLWKQGAVTPPNCFEVRLNGDSALRARTATIVGDTWYHVAATFNGTTSLKIYLNGTLATGATITSTSLTDAATQMEVAGRASNNFRTGSRMDELRFYKRELDATEINAIYNEELP